jgi:MFS family permease
MSAFAISELAISPFVGNFIDAIGRKNCFILGILLNAFSNVIFGMASYSSSETVYLYVSLFARSMSGVGDAMILICTPVMIVATYPDKKE